MNKTSPFVDSQSHKEEMDNRKKDEDVSETAKGTAGSTLGGAVAGAGAGTALGVPVVGTVIGALSGAAIGAARKRNAGCKKAIHKSKKLRRRASRGCQKDSGQKAHAQNRGASAIAFIRG